MTHFSASTIALRSCQYFWRQHLAILASVAIATAVLVGAFMVGDSVRGSLESLALDRLGRIDHFLAATHFFRPELANELSQNPGFASRFRSASAFTIFPQVTIEKMGSRANRLAGLATKVQLFGAGLDFFRMSEEPDPELASIGEREIWVTENLADELQLKVGDQLVVRLPSLTAAPEESPFGRRDSAVVTLAGLKVSRILPNTGIAAFQPFPSQQQTRNVFVSPDALQRAFGKSMIANAMVVESANWANSVSDSAALNELLTPTLEDFGVSVSRVQGKYNDSSDGQVSADQPPTSAPKVAWSYWSISTDQLVFSDSLARILQTRLLARQPQVVRVYLANSIESASGKRPIPYSMVCALDEHPHLGPFRSDDGTIVSANPEAIWLNSWLADRLEAKIGDQVTLRYYLPETTHGDPQETTKTFTVAGILLLTQPETPFRRSDQATFNLPPTWASDPDLTPTVEGVSDRDSIEDWDPPFPFDQKRIDSADDDYWEYHRATPKAFISASAGATLWKSRYGSVTSLRIPERGDVSGESLSQDVMEALQTQKDEWGLVFRPIKHDNLQAARGTTPFEFLFLGFSLFLVLSALMLVALVTRLGIQMRAKAWHVLQAIGWDPRRIARLISFEFGTLGMLGGLLGMPLGILYAAGMIHGLRTWWRQAIVTPFVELHVTWQSLLLGFLLSFLVTLAVIVIWARPTHVLTTSGKVRRSVNRARQVLSGFKAIGSWLPGLLAVAAMGLSIFSLKLSGEAQAGGFFGAGFLFLIVGLLVVSRIWRATSTQRNPMTLLSWAWRSCGRNMERSLLTAGLVAAASFLIIAIGAFRLEPNARGTGSFALVGESDRPLFVRWDDRSNGPRVASFSVLAGDDASCRNLYQAMRPRILGVRPESLPLLEGQEGQDRFQFTQRSLSARTPWQALSMSLSDGSIPVILDRNTAMYALHVAPRIGSIFEMEVDGAGTRKFCIQGLLVNSILQGNLMVANAQLLQLQPDNAGDRFFLVDTSRDAMDEVASSLEREFADQGLDLKRSSDVLRDLLAIQNTYLSTFQSLGGLGLVLGTFGLAAVMIRNIFERRRELGLLSALGFAEGRLRQLIAMEHLALLLVGLAIGISASLLASLPQSLLQGSQGPWSAIGILIVCTSVVAALATWFATRKIQPQELFKSLLDE